MISALNGKKGNAFIDSLWVLVTVFSVGLMFMFSYSILGDVNDEFQASDSMSNLSKQKMASLESGFPSWMDYAFLTMFVLLWVGAVLFSFFIDAHPVFIVITLALLLLVLLLGAVMSNTYAEISEETGFDTNAFPITNFILNNLLIVVIVIGLSIVLALYGKNQLGGGGF